MRFTIPEYAKKFGYNETYVRHCCNRYVDPRTKWTYKLRRGHYARLEGPGQQNWVIYTGGLSSPQRDLDASVDSTQRAQNETALVNSDSLMGLLNGVARRAKAQGRSESLEVVISADGSWSLPAKSGDDPIDLLRPGADSHIAVGSFAELTAAALLWELGARERAAQDGSASAGHSFLNDALKQSWAVSHRSYVEVVSCCLHCFGSLAGKRKQARFCSPQCKGLHAAWVDRTASSNDRLGAVLERVNRAVRA